MSVSGVESLIISILETCEGFYLRVKLVRSYTIDRISRLRVVISAGVRGEVLRLDNERMLFCWS